MWYFTVSLLVWSLYLFSDTEKVAVCRWGTRIGHFLSFHLQTDAAVLIGDVNREMRLSKRALTATFPAVGEKEKWMKTKSPAWLPAAERWMPPGWRPWQSLDGKICFHAWTEHERWISGWFCAWLAGGFRICSQITRTLDTFGVF